jgi:hypothetical protein
MVEAVAISLFILANSIALATPLQQTAAWNAQSELVHDFYRNQARFIVSNH